MPSTLTAARFLGLIPHRAAPCRCSRQPEMAESSLMILRVEWLNLTPRETQLRRGSRERASHYHHPGMDNGLLLISLGQITASHKSRYPTQIGRASCRERV